MHAVFFVCLFFFCVWGFCRGSLGSLMRFFPEGFPIAAFCGIV